MKKVGLLLCLALLTGCTSKLESKIEITDNNKDTIIELQDKSFITKYNVLYNGKDIKEGINLGTRKSFADIGATVADILNVSKTKNGTSFKEEVMK